jgi:hypothetical protein
VEQSEEMGYSFWNPEGGKADFRSADTIEVRTRTCEPCFK